MRVKSAFILVLSMVAAAGASTLTRADDTALACKAPTAEWRAGVNKGSLAAVRAFRTKVPAKCTELVAAVAARIKGFEQPVQPVKRAPTPVPSPPRKPFYSTVGVDCVRQAAFGPTKSLIPDEGRAAIARIDRSKLPPNVLDVLDKSIVQLNLALATEARAFVVKACSMSSRTTVAGGQGRKSEGKTSPEGWTYERFAEQSPGGENFITVRFYVGGALGGEKAICLVCHDRPIGFGNAVDGGLRGYFGEYRGDKEEGLGVYLFRSGGAYAGQWRSGTIDGYGVTFFNNGQIEIGQFTNGAKNGVIILLNADGKRSSWRLEENGVPKSDSWKFF